MSSLLVTCARELISSTDFAQLPVSKYKFCNILNQKSCETKVKQNKQVAFKQTEKQFCCQNISE